ESALCRYDRDCAPEERCCLGGALGRCVPLESSAQCPLPDLAIGLLDIPSGLEEVSILPNDCALGCYEGSGRRRIVLIQPRLFNVGGADAMLGALDAPGTQLGCTPYLENALIYELRGADDSLVRRVDARLKPGCSDRQTHTGFSCDFLGLDQGLYDD